MATSPQLNEELPPPSEAGGGVDLREYLQVLWTYKWLILGVTAAISAAVIFWTLRQPKIYQASCTIEYDPNPVRPLGSEVEDITNPIGSYWMSREFFATQNEIITSRTVAERVVQALHLRTDPDFFGIPEHERDEWEGASLEEAAAILQRRITVEPIKDTRIVAIRVTDHDPERARTLANTVAEQYIKKTEADRSGTTEQTQEDLTEQTAELRAALERSELALHEFKREHDVLSVSMDDQQNLVAARITHYHEKLQEAISRRRELEGRLERIRTLVGGDDVEASAAQFPDHAPLSAMRAALRAKEAERAALAQHRYGPNHQRIQTLVEEINQLREQMRRELDGLLRAAQADVDEIRRIEAGHRADLRQAHEEGHQLNAHELAYRTLVRNRDEDALSYEKVRERSRLAGLTSRHKVSFVRMLDTALVPRVPISPNFTTNAAGGLGAGLVLGLALAFLLSRLDRRLKSVADVEHTGLTVLGILPRIDVGDEAPARSNGKRRRRQPRTTGDSSRDLFVHTHPMSAAAECCRTIRTNLTFMSAGEPLRALVVTSASPREGKTTVTANVAISLAQSGKRVLLVDTDLRRPRVHRVFGVSATRGVTSIVVGEAEFESAVQSSSIPNLDVLACGPIPPNPSELLHSQRFAELVEKALEHYDRVVFDSPPLGAVTDAAVLAPQLDGVLVVVKAQSTTRDALASALRQLRDVNANVLGAVLNDVDPKRKGYGAGDYYYYYRGEGYSREDGEDEPTEEERPMSPPPS